jgi:hypothetical protein
MLPSPDEEPNMPQLKKKEVLRAIVQAKEMLERNGNSIETFEGVLSRGYVRALKTLVELGEQFLEQRRPVQQ